MKKRAQSSLEFLMIFGIGFMLVLLLSGLFYSYFIGEKESLDIKQISSIGLEIMDNVEKIYYLGDGNKITMTANFPDRIQNMTIHHKNITNPNTGNQHIFDVFNITYYGDDIINSLTFETQAEYIRFNCTRCASIPAQNLSYYNDTSDFSGGFKRIKIESYGDWVSIDFLK